MTHNLWQTACNTKTWARIGLILAALISLNACSEAPVEDEDPTPNPCANISCEMPPASSCEDEVAVIYAATGTCEAGTCSYEETRTDCASTDQRCQSGACVAQDNRCDNISCEMPPVPSCEAEVAVTYATPGTCAAGMCSYEETRIDCSAEDKRCDAGACIEQVNLCENVTCEMPPEPSCDAQVALTYPDIGICEAGMCSYEETRTDCTAQDYICVSGVCVEPPIVQVDTRGLHTCALRPSGEALCWGWNEHGRLGDGTTIDRRIPTLVVGLSDAAEIATSYGHTCARRQNGEVMCWGLNTFGRLGDGTETDRLVPTPVAGVNDAIELVAGGAHTCARRQNGQVVCWGLNTNGQLGDGTTTNRNVPTPVEGLTDAVKLAAGELHTCALRQSGQVVCWGFNGSGRLGDGTEERRLVPTSVRGMLTDAVDLAANSGHTCALRQSNSVVCWGWNSSNQLGDGTTTKRLLPTVVRELSDAVKIAAGYFHTCAVRQNGRVVCWGDNDQGALGTGTNADSNVPVIVMDLTNAADITAGSAHTCARRQDGTVVCWGSNSNGQLGNDTTGDRSVPTPVVGL